MAAYKRLNETAKADAARKKMVELLEQFVKLHPQNALALSILAEEFAENKNRQRAVATIQTAQALAPNDPQVSENIGIAYEKLGDRTQSIRYVRQAMSQGLPLDDVMTDPDLQKLVADPKFEHQNISSGPGAEAKPKPN